MSEKLFVACDLGAESGRVMLGRLSAGKLELEEVHRFPNAPVSVMGSMRWDVLGLFREMKVGLKKVAERGVAVTSLSVDSWGVDYVWVGAGQPMLAPPYIYRDVRIDAAAEAALAKVDAARIYGETGIQFMNFNTVFQLFADMQNSAKLVGVADQFLCIADYFNFLFSGVGRAEESLASTTQIYNPVQRGWSEDLIGAFGVPRSVFPQIVPSGTRLGALLPEVCEETGLADTSVVATCSHDTGAAVAAVPAELNDRWAFLSSGTWSLIGVELDSPLVTPEAREANFTNEGGYGGTTRFLKNIVGLWILQESRRTWERAGQVYSYAELTRLAAESEPLVSLINPDDPRFLKPGDMPARIAEFCRETGQPVPEGAGAITRCILESLALLYRSTLSSLESITGRKIDVLHIVGGGSQSELLNQFAADATGRTVVAGPVEATAIGNILIQAITAGELTSLDDLRGCVRKSFPTTTYQQKDEAAWEDAFARSLAMRGTSA